MTHQWPSPKVKYYLRFRIPGKNNATMLMGGLYDGLFNRILIAVEGLPRGIKNLTSYLCILIVHEYCHWAGDMESPWHYYRNPFGTEKFVEHFEAMVIK
jgi:hypothetical protein